MWCRWKASWPTKICLETLFFILSQLEWWKEQIVTWVSSSWPSSVGWMLISYSWIHFQIIFKSLKSRHWKPCSPRSGSQSHWGLWVESWRGSRRCSSSLDGWSFQSNRLLQIPSEKNFPSQVILDSHLMMLRAECDSVILNAGLSDRPKNRHLLLPGE